MKNDLQEKALKLELKGKFEEAADLYLKAGRPEKAAFMYQKTGNTSRAIQACVEGGMFAKGAELAQKVGGHAQAAHLYEKAEALDRAAACWEKAGDFRKAADLWERLGQSERAAEFHFKAGQYLKAGALWEKAKKDEQAIQAYRQYIVESAGILSQLTGPDAQRIAGLFIKARDFVRAAEIYLKTSEPLKGFLLLLEAGEMERATDLYRRQFKGQGFRILSQLTKDPQIEALGEVCMAVQEFPEAAQCFEKTGNTLKSAQAYEASGDLYQAAELFMQIGKFREAAELYDKAGHNAAAADLYYKLKDFGKAAACFEREGDFYKAGRLYQYQGNHQKAIQLLQKIASDHPEYLKASILICKAFLAVGLNEMAVKRYQEIAAEYPVSEETLETYYDMAELLFTMNDPKGAKEILEKIVNVDLTYKDAAQKLRRLTTSTVPKPAPAPPMPLPPPAAPVPPPANRAPQPAPPAAAGPPTPPPAPRPPQPTPAPAPPPPPATAARPLPSPPPTIPTPPPVPMPKEEKKALRPTKAVQILRKFPFFQNLEEEEIQLLWDTLDRKEVPGGTTLVRAGDYAPGFYLLVHGSVELLTTMGRAIITLHEPGTLFGIAAYFSGETSAVSIRTTEACKLIIINGERFARALEANPALKEKALPLLARSLEGESAVIPAKTPYHTQVLEAKKRLL